MIEQYAGEMKGLRSPKSYKTELARLCFIRLNSLDLSHVHFTKMGAGAFALRLVIPKRSRLGEAEVPILHVRVQLSRLEEGTFKNNLNIRVNMLVRVHSQ